MWAQQLAWAEAGFDGAVQEAADGYLTGEAANYELYLDSASREEFDEQVQTALQTYHRVLEGANFGRGKAKGGIVICFVSQPSSLAATHSPVPNIRSEQRRDTMAEGGLKAKWVAGVKLPITSKAQLFPGA